MMQYIEKTDKRGNARYYKIVEGKMKTVSRAEFEANATKTVEVEVPATVTTAVVSENIRDPKTVETVVNVPAAAMTALEAVKGIVSGMEGKDAEKVKLQVTKRAILINYRNCMVCSLVFDENNAVTAVRFMGATLETRKAVTVCDPADIRSYAERVTEQVVFIDWWWLNSSRKKTA